MLAKNILHLITKQMSGLCYNGSPLDRFVVLLIGHVEHYTTPFSRFTHSVSLMSTTSEEKFDPFEKFAFAKRDLCLSISLSVASIILMKCKNLLMNGILIRFFICAKATKRAKPSIRSVFAQ